MTFEMTFIMASAKAAEVRRMHGFGAIAARRRLGARGSFWEPSGNQVKFYIASKCRNTSIIK